MTEKEQDFVSVALQEILLEGFPGGEVSRWSRIFIPLFSKKATNTGVALCLENGLVGQGISKDSAMERLKKAIDSFWDVIEKEGLKEGRKEGQREATVATLHTV